MRDANEEARALIELGRSVIERAVRAGADVAEAGVHSGAHLSVKVRMGEPELVEEAGSRALVGLLDRWSAACVAARSFPPDPRKRAGG